MADSTAKAAFKPLGQRLLDAGLITEPQLKVALSEHKRKGIFLGDALEELKILDGYVIAKFLAEETGTELVDLTHYAIDIEAVKLVPYELAKKHRILPLSKKGNILTAALADTLNVAGIDALEKATGLSVKVVTAPKGIILEAIEQHFAGKVTIDQTIEEILKKGTGELADVATGDVLPMISLVDQVIGMGIKKRATDIHVEPEEEVLRVRIRVDGVLRQEVIVPKVLQTGFTARIKIMGGMDITQTRTPQDGRISFHIEARTVDIRVSSLPTSNGEALVLRVLDKGSMTLELPALGFSPKDQETLNTILKMPHGLALVTGPTGSGKTSTLYSALGIVSTLERSVLTLEDPIEFNLPLIRQTGVRPDLGLDFANGLRTILRQDPDVIMVGEIRDVETAELSIRAALTGHLVLSTLHTNTAAGAAPRLSDMGVKPYLISASLQAVVAQRLARRVCKHCKKKVESPNLEALNALKVPIPEGYEINIMKGEGCNACAGTGYMGRVGIYEIMRIDSSFHDLFIENAGEDEIVKHASTKPGYHSMAEDGMEKIVLGITSLEEVLKVIF